MMPKELDFLNNRTYDWFLNNSTLMTEDDFDNLKKTDMVLEMYKESFLLMKRDLKPGPSVNVMWDFISIQDAKGQSGIPLGLAIAQGGYVCEKYSFIFDIQGNLLPPDHIVREENPFRIVGAYLLKDWINENNQSEGISGVWQFRKMNHLSPSFLNWSSDNPFEVK